MQDPIDFFESLLDAEHRALLAGVSGVSADFDAARDAAAAHFAGGMADVGQWLFSSALRDAVADPGGEEFPDPFFAEFAGAALDKKRYVRRPLFLVRHHVHPQRGHMFEAWVGSEQEDGLPTALCKSLLAWAVAGELRVVTQRDPCIECDATGAVSLQPCEACAGSGWRKVAGLKAGAPGEHQQTIRFERPEHPPHGQVYDGA